MRIPQFEIRNERSIRLAKCDRVPPLMLVAGPNGSGKSTLLHALRTNYAYEGIVYVGPHRAMRRQHVQQRHLISARISVEELLQRRDIQGFDGISLVGGTRDPWSYDDSANYLKHALCQVEVDRTQAIAARFDQFGEIKKGSLPDPWRPLRDLTTNLLPHLSFHRIDASNRDAIRCLWTVHSKEIEVDIDELSSGEKSIIQMFYPLVEHEIRAILNDVQGNTGRAARADLCVLIDEPELHLHPNLQQKVLDYLRVLTTGSNTQVILATHSPTMVESASFEELFLLRPLELVIPEENQLVQIADNEERLRYLREVFGTTSNLTALQPVIVVEGASEKDVSRVAADRKLYRALHSGFDHVTLLPGGGKGQCKALLDVLGPALSTFSSNLRAVGLLDRDQATTEVRPDVFLLPVAMIENFLLDPDSIWEAIQSVVEKTGLKSVDDVASAIDSILDELEAAEIERRTLVDLGLAYFRPVPPLTNVPMKAAEFGANITARFSADNVEKSADTAKQAVEAFKASNRRREEFHGKVVLDSFFKRHLHSAGLQKAIFTFEAARYARRRRAVTQYFDDLFAKLSSNARVVGGVQE
jgi:hypothetical protein